MMKMIQKLGTLAAVAGVLTLSGCAATEMAIEHHSLDVRSRMSSTVFLKPVPDAEHTVYVQVRNTSDQNVDAQALTQSLTSALEARGYQAAGYERAHYLLQVNLLQVGKMDPSAADMSLSSGFGGAVAGGTLAAMNGSSGRGIAVGALAGGVVDLVASTLVKNVTYTAITDVQITENGAQPAIYKTRILSTANQVNLEFQEALQPLEAQTVHSIAGIF